MGEVTQKESSLSQGSIGRDQASELRQLALGETRSDRLAPPHMVLVAGSEGGIGVTTLGLHLASVLREQLNAPLLVIDAHPISHRLRTSFAHPRTLTTPDLWECLDSNRPLEEAIFAGPSGLHLAGRSSGNRNWGAWQLRSCQRLMRLLARVGDRWPWVVLLGGAGPNPWDEVYWQEADSVVLVSGEDDLALLATLQMLRMAESFSPQQSRCVLFNKSLTSFASDSAQDRLSEASERFLGKKSKILGRIPHSKELDFASRSGKTLSQIHQDSAAYQPMVAAARILVDISRQPWQARRAG